MSCVTSFPFPCYVCKRYVVSSTRKNWLSCISLLTLADLEPERIIIPIFIFDSIFIEKNSLEKCHIFG